MSHTGCTWISCISTQETLRASQRYKPCVAHVCYPAVSFVPAWRDRRSSACSRRTHNVRQAPLPYIRQGVYPCLSCHFSTRILGYASYRSHFLSHGRIRQHSSTSRSRVPNPQGTVRHTCRVCTCRLNGRTRCPCLQALRYISDNPCLQC